MYDMAQYTSKLVLFVVLFVEQYALYSTDEI